MLTTVCKVSVDLPIPGSPPNNTRLPGTNPPPSTRLSSSSGVQIRAPSCDDISFNLKGRLPISGNPFEEMAV